MELREMINQAVADLMKEKGSPDVYHPELGWVVQKGRATHSLISFFKKLERKRTKSLNKMQDSSK